MLLQPNLQLLLKLEGEYIWLKKKPNLYFGKRITSSIKWQSIMNASELHYVCMWFYTCMGVERLLIYTPCINVYLKKRERTVIFLLHQVFDEKQTNDKKSKTSCSSYYYCHRFACCSCPISLYFILYFLKYLYIYK